MKSARAKLTKDERDVLILVARGLTNKQISEQLNEAPAMRLQGSMSLW